MKKRKSQNFFITHSKFIAAMIVIVFVAAGGVYYLGFGRANRDFGSAMFDATIEGVPFQSHQQAQTGVQYSLHIGGRIINYSHDALMQAVAVISYDSRLVQLISTACNHDAGCYISQVPNSFGADSMTESLLHKDRVLVCLNGPAFNSEKNSASFLTLTFRATTSFDVSNPGWLAVGTVIAPGSCSSNILGKNSRYLSTFGTCITYSHDCNTGPVSSSVTGTLFGFSTIGDSVNKTPPSIPKEAPIPTSTSTVNKDPPVSESPNSSPDASPQGEGKTIAEMKQSPFYDGKLFESGSESTAALGTVSLGGKKYSVLLIVLSSITVLLVAGGVFGWHWWRRRHK